MSVEKLNLNPFRAFLFFFFGGAGCLLPFVSLHLKSTSLTKDQIRLISYGSPLIASLGPIFFGPLVDYLSGKRKTDVKNSTSRSDRTSCIRIILSIAVLLSAIFYCLLLSVGTVENHNLRRPEASFVCNEYGASLVQEKCNELSCFEYMKAETGTATLHNCKFNCDLPSHFGYLEKPYGDAEIEKKVASAASGMATTTTTTTTRTTTSNIMSIRPEIDISNLDEFFGSEPNDDYDDGASGSGEDTDFNWGKKTRQRREVQGDSGFSLEESPHICHDKLIGGKMSRTCYVFTPNSAALNVSLFLKPFHEDLQHCSYPLALTVPPTMPAAIKAGETTGKDVCSFSTRSNNPKRSNFSCRIPRGMEKPNESCKVICDLEKVYSSDSILIHSQCSRSNSDPNLTFWTYLTFRSLGDLFFSTSVALALGATIVAVGDKAGREFVLPSLSYGLFAIVVGYLHSDDLSLLQVDNIPNFYLGIVGYGIFIFFALLVLIFAPNLCLGPPDWWRTSRNVQIKSKAEFFALLLVLVLLGMLWGPIFFQIPWHISTVESLELYVGCAASLGALISAPLARKAYKIVDYCGYSNILIGAFTIYILRYTGLLFIENPWVLSAIGSMEAITLCLMLFSSVFYIRHLVPKHLTFTSQGLGIAAHFCLGGGLGCFVSTLLSPSDADLEAKALNSTNSMLESESEIYESEFEAPYHLIYCVGASAAAISAVAYFLLYHCCLKMRCMAPLYRSDHDGAPGHDSGEKGMYTPLRIIRNGRQAKDDVEN